MRSLANKIGIYAIDARLVHRRHNGWHFGFELIATKPSDVMDSLVALSD
jgi:hypothetical protein